DVGRRRLPVPRPGDAPPVRRHERAAERRKRQDAVDERARPHETDPLPIASRGDIDFSGVTRRSPTDHCTIVAPPHPPAARVPPSPPLRGGEGRGEVGALPPSRAASELEL